ncbi:MAG: CoA transferase [Pseudomonadota bacterium]
MLKPYIVLDFTDERGEIGPMLLGDLGADVIKVELPGGTTARSAPPLLQGDAPTRSLQFLAFNRNKRSIVLDPKKPADQEVLEKLLGRADFIFESSPSRTLEAFGYDHDRVCGVNPRVVHVCLSPFGLDGPYKNFVGNDLVIASMGGPVYLQGTPDRPPVRLSVPQVWRHAGVEAAAGAMVAHARMINTGKAQFVDLSAQSVMTWTMLNAMDAHAIQGFDFRRGGSAVNNGNVILDIVHPTLDGYVVALPMSKLLLGCKEWMQAEGVITTEFDEVDWEDYDVNVRDPDLKPLNLDQAVAICRKFVGKHTKQELFEFGLANGLTFAPVNTLDELLALQHVQTRDYWDTLQVGGHAVKTPGLWCKPSNGKISVRRTAPQLDEHGAQVRAELDLPRLSPSYPDPVGEELPFAGLKVADFSWVGVGPISAKYLADHGAEVVRVESENRPDVLRGGGPFKDAEPGINRSQFFGDFNTSKQSMTLNMKSPEAIEIAKKLIGDSDVMIESFAPGAIKRMGLDYESVSQFNPGLIMISTCLMGQTGPAAGMAGYGYHAGAMAGFYEVIGWADRDPAAPWVAYTDTIAPRFISTLLAAALDHRRRTGEGCYIDVAQIETALHFLAPEFLDLQLNGYSASRMGNRLPYLAPQGVYPCLGEDNWCAIAIDEEDQWRAFAQLMDRDDWLSEAYDSHTKRAAHHDEIDTAIADWTHAQEAQALMRRLQAQKIPAGVVQKSSDLLADPQYQYRGFYRYYDHPEMGNIPYAGHQYRISNYDNGPRGPAPTMGQHSFEILSLRLGLADEALAEAYATGVIN